jgi:hypothetical protein
MRLLIAAILLHGMGSCSIAYADFPPNSAYVPEYATNVSSVGKIAFANAIKRVQNVYGPILKRDLGCDLKIINNWQSPVVNAYADRVGSECQVEMMGGFARYGRMTVDAVIEVLCHEVGHHYGGPPRYSRDWASCEGQSDYWAQKCMKKVIGNAPARIKFAGRILGDTLASLSRENPVSDSTPDLSRANGIYCSHPGAQCRYDTYIAGIHNRRRPKCWYNP